MRVLFVTLGISVLAVIGLASMVLLVVLVNSMVQVFL